MWNMRRDSESGIGMNRKIGLLSGKIFCDFRGTRFGQASQPPIPDPAGQADGIYIGPSGKLVDGNPGKCRIAAPFAFARHHEIQVEGVDEAHAFSPHVRIDTDECLVEKDQPRRMWARATVEGGRGSEVRQS